VAAALAGRTLHRIAEQGGEAHARLGGREVYVLAAPALGNAEHLSLGVTVVRAGTASASHTHAAEEAIVVLDGRLRLVVGGSAVELAAGDGVVIPPDVAHRVEQPGAAEATALWVYAPAGPERRLLP
jgi:putative monooxygenase